MLVIAVFAMAPMLSMPHAALLLPAVGKDPTLSERTVIWAAVWTTIVKATGSGLWIRSFLDRVARPILEYRADLRLGLMQAQNGFLDMWLQVGIAGVILICSQRDKRRGMPYAAFVASGQDSYVRWCIVVIITTLVYNIGESSLGMVQLVWFLFLLACIGLKQTAMAKHRGASLSEHEQGLPLSDRTSVA